MVQLQQLDGRQAHKSSLIEIRTTTNHSHHREVVPLVNQLRAAFSLGGSLRS